MQKLVYIFFTNISPVKLYDKVLSISSFEKNKNQYLKMFF